MLNLIVLLKYLFILVVVEIFIYFSSFFKFLSELGLCTVWAFF